MANPRNITSLASLRESLQGVETFYVVDYQGLNAAGITRLRRALSTQGSRMVVAKNTLVNIALKDAGRDVCSLDLPPSSSSRMTRQVPPKPWPSLPRPTRKVFPTHAAECWTASALMSKPSINWPAWAPKTSSAQKWWACSVHTSPTSSECSRRTKRSSRTQRKGYRFSVVGFQSRSCVC